MQNPLRYRQVKVAFGLRTLFVVVALLALPLAWMRREVDLIAEWRAALCEMSRDLQRVRGRYQNWGTYTPAVLERTRDDVSWLRAALGDQRQRSIVLPYAVHDDRTRRFSQLFPETTVRCLDRSLPSGGGGAPGTTR